jgi:hypothetical protein
MPRYSPSAAMPANSHLNTEPVSTSAFDRDVAAHLGGDLPADGKAESAAAGVRVASSLTRKNSSNRNGMYFSGIPIPVSATETPPRRPGARPRPSPCRPGRLYLMAFATRLSNSTATQCGRRPRSSRPRAGCRAPGYLLGLGLRLVGGKDVGDHSLEVHLIPAPR